jgi:hypothetical protein
MKKSNIIIALIISNLITGALLLVEHNEPIDYTTAKLEVIKEEAHRNMNRPASFLDYTTKQANFASISVQKESIYLDGVKFWVISNGPDIEVVKAQ